jgi:hypothetical protein
MRLLLIVAGLVLTAALVPLRAVEPYSTPALGGTPGQGFDAAWLGEIWGPAGKLRVFVRLFEDDGRLTGSMDSLDERIRNLEIRSALAFGRQLQFELVPPKATFDGELNADGSELTGLWKQDGHESWVVLRRLAGRPGKR